MHSIEQKMKEHIKPEMNALAQEVEFTIRVLEQRQSVLQEHLMTGIQTQFG